MFHLYGWNMDVSQWPFKRCNDRMPPGLIVHGEVGHDAFRLVSGPMACDLTGSKVVGGVPAAVKLRMTEGRFVEAYSVENGGECASRVDVR
jgi:hypothetical protein